MGTPPSPSARGVPAGARLRDGFKTLIVFAGQLTVSLWEKAVKPPGLDGGEAIDTTTMLSTLYRQRAHRQLKTLTDVGATCGYDPSMYTTLLNLININTVVTVHFPDTSSLAFYGFLRSVEPNELVEGTFPEVRITVTCTNTDYSDGSEQAPVYTAGTGTAA